MRSTALVRCLRPAVLRPQFPVAVRYRRLSGEVTKPASASGGDVTVEPLKNERGEVRETHHSHSQPTLDPPSPRPIPGEKLKPIHTDAMQIIKHWGTTLELPVVTKQEAQEAYLDATSVTRSLKPAIQEAVAARDDMLKDLFNYVSKNLNPDAQYVVMGKHGAVAPAAIGQGSFLIAGLVVLLGAIGGVVYIKTQWQVGSAKELGDRLRERGAKRKEMLERSTSATLVRTFSENAETVVKSNVELVRRPSQQMGAHFQESFKGVVKENRP